jgi:hypothetical protein
VTRSRLCEMRWKRFCEGGDGKDAVDCEVKWEIVGEADCMVICEVDRQSKMCG